MNGQTQRAKITFLHAFSVCVRACASACVCMFVCSYHNHHGTIVHYMYILVLFRYFIPELYLHTAFFNHTYVHACT